MNPERVSSAPNQTHELKVKHILVVDDDVELAESYKELLESYGYAVTTVSNGVEALKVIMNMDVDAILCDLMMPHMAGDMFYLAVERVKPHLCQRFVFVTAYEGHPQFAQFLKKVNAVALYKPVTLGKLLGTLSVLFSRNPAGTKAG
ncbi:MAG: response regulator [Limisphaerales bacterium]